MAFDRRCVHPCNALDSSLAPNGIRETAFPVAYSHRGTRLGYHDDWAYRVAFFACSNLPECDDLAVVFQKLLQHIPSDLQAVFQIPTITNTDDLSFVVYADNKNSAASVRKTRNILRECNFGLPPFWIVLHMPNRQRPEIP